jgi:hypothetical protein
MIRVGRSEHLVYPLLWGCHCRGEHGRRSVATVKMRDLIMRPFGCIHKIGTVPAMHVNVDKSRK